jgi:hypothetical protein
MAKKTSKKKADAKAKEPSAEDALASGASTRKVLQILIREQRPNAVIQGGSTMKGLKVDTTVLAKRINEVFKLKGTNRYNPGDIGGITTVNQLVADIDVRRKPAAKKAAKKALAAKKAPAGATTRQRLEALIREQRPGAVIQGTSTMSGLQVNTTVLAGRINTVFGLTGANAYGPGDIPGGTTVNQLVADIDVRRAA